MIFFVLLLILMVVAYVAQTFIGPLPVMGARVLLMQMLMLYGSIALPLPGMVAITFLGGLMWDGLHITTIGDTQQVYDDPQTDYTKRLVAAIPTLAKALSGAGTTDLLT